MPEPKRKAQLTLRCPEAHMWKVQGDALTWTADFVDEIVCEKCGEVGEVRVGEPVNCEEEES